MNTIGLVTATRSDRETFLRESALGRSLAQLQAMNAPVQLYLAERNTSPLALHYNRAIRQAPDGQILVFVHDDVGLLDRHLSTRLEEALRHFDVVGVVGNRVMRPRQPAWSFPEKLGQWDMAHRLLGAVHHELPDGKQVFNRYGDTRCKAAVIDGLFIAARADVLRQNAMAFDPALAFHFYDLDFCVQLNKTGLRTGVWPIAISHASAGGYGNESWKQAYAIFCKKHWGEPTSAPQDKTGPISAHQNTTASLGSMA
jgi:GT2 family glycosyltransferase